MFTLDDELKMLQARVEQIKAQQEAELQANSLAPRVERETAIALHAKLCARDSNCTWTDSEHDDDAAMADWTEPEHDKFLSMAKGVVAQLRAAEIISSSKN